MENSNNPSEGLRQFSLENDTPLDWLKRTKPNPPIQGKTHLACSNRDKAEVLADTLEKSFKPNQACKLTVEVEQEITKQYLKYSPEPEAATIEE
ncbi:hypothetical protein NDU88_000841 [Pleurodeles waltl]|uniref:Uncharacterized protein n=1 Tax=Pleurodeles waltl TaxID=8319 RepID=A0AAV7LAV6_PLEWA|nr:hypothetical protein NDU88_000841 [Pleurodeles waltl]